MDLNYKNENKILTIFIEGRVDTANAEIVEGKINEIREKESYDVLVLDVEKLLYISSAGLRTILRLRKIEKNMKVINASSEVYDIFEMTGFTEIVDVEKAYRRMSVEGCQVIGEGAKGTVYRIDEETIIKVYKNNDSLPDIQKERALARKAFVLGLPTAISYDIVMVGDKYGAVFELLNAKSFSQVMIEDETKYSECAKDYAELLKQIHTTEVDSEGLPNTKGIVNQWIEKCKGILDEQDYEKAYKLIQAASDKNVLIHGDYHTNNLMYQNGEVMLIDMDTLSYGNPIFELANCYFTYKGQSEVDVTMIKKFIGIDHTTGEKFWDAFLPIYLGTEDKDRICEVENKAKFLAYLRLIGHIRKREKTIPNAENMYKYALGKIHEIIGLINELDF